LTVLLAALVDVWGRSMLAVKFDSGAVVLDDVPAPSGAGVRVKVRACGICASDVSILDSGFRLAGIPGHEIAGELEDGTPVAIEPLDICGRCRYCESGDHQVCENGTQMILGIGRDGGMAEEIVCPERCLVPLPRSLDATTAFLVEPLAVAIHGVRRSGIDQKARVLVVGGGTIGLCAVIAAASVHAEVDLVARHPAQIKAALRLGASVVESGQGGNYDVVLDCAGTSSAAVLGCEALRPNGRLVMLAAPWDKIVLPGLAVMSKELELVMSTAYGRSGTTRDVDVAARILGSREEISDVLITHRFPLSKAPEAFAQSRDRQGGAIKVVLEP
jgi:threonine dehydrogenase-like Zn-dependent dehydrogenase